MKPYGALLVLLLVQVMSQWDRQLLGYLAGIVVDECTDVCDGVKEPVCKACPLDDAKCSICHDCLEEYHIDKYNIQDATCISGVEFGLLTGLAFAAVYVFFGVAAGRLVDVTHRVRLLTAALFLWSVSSAAQALATGFGGLLAARLAVAIFESFTNPASYSILGSIFAPEQLGTANGILACSVYLGGGLGSLSIEIAKVLGWRLTTVLSGGIGVVLAVIAISYLREPRRMSDPNTVPSAVTDDSPVLAPVSPSSASSAAATAGAAAAYSEVEPDLSTPAAESGDVKLLPSSPSHSHGGHSGSRSTSVAVHGRGGRAVSRGRFGWCRDVFRSSVVCLLFLAASLRFFGGFALGSFLVKYYQAEFPERNDDYSVANALIVAFGGILSSLGGGLVSDRLVARWGIASRAWVPLIGTLGAIPFVVLTLTVKHFEMSMAFLFLEYIMAECWFGPSYALLNAELNPSVLGSGVALFAVCANTLGSLSPPLLGVFYDHEEAKADIRWPLMVFVVASYATAGVAFAVIGVKLQRRQRLLQR